MSGKKPKDLLDELQRPGELGPPTQGPVPMVDDYLKQPLAPQGGDLLDELQSAAPTPVATPTSGGAPNTTPASSDGSMMDLFLGGGHSPDSYGINQLPGPPDQELLDTIGDTGVGAANGATMNYGDELAGLLGGQGAQDAVNQRVMQAHSRSPVASRVGEGLGGAATTAMIPGAGPMAAIAKGGISGFAAGSGAANGADFDQRMQAGGRGMAAGAATAALPVAAGGAMQAAGRGAGMLGSYASRVPNPAYALENAGKMAPAGAPLTLPSPMADQMKRTAMYTLGSAGAWGNPAHAVGTAAGMAAGSAFVPPMTAAMAKPLGAALSGGGQAISGAAQSLAGAMAPAEGQKFGSRAGYQGNEVEGQVRKLVDPENPQGWEVLGPYLQQFQEAAQKDTIGALIDRLENSDDEFRTQVSPKIRMAR